MSTIKIDDAKAVYFDKQLGRLRTWMQGFKAAGGTPPHDEDVLRQLQIVLGDRK